MRKISCAKCKQEFVCNGSGYDCWCFEKPYIRLDETEKYDDCLCEQCLIDIHNERSKDNNQG
jgi:hypothetical protein